MKKQKIVFSVFTVVILVLGIFSAGCTTSTANSSGSPAETAVQAQNTPTSLPITATSAVVTTTLPAAATTAAVQYTTYTNSQYGITLSYPSDWEMQESGQLAIRDYGRDTINVVNFFSPGNDSYVTFSVDVDPSTTTDLGKYYNLAVIALQNYYPYLVMTKHDAQLEVSGNLAYSIDYQVPLDDNINSGYGHQVYTIVEGTPYIFSYEGANISPTNDVYAAHLGEAQDMIRSVTISPVTSTVKSR
ncbi:MAG: hypothetical protein WCE46_05240 [Methanoregula sp.]|jgi:hypothetical protein|uniref:hypothetical protein n=1 Tax=Methanoregula sp. TaxID=2052170 RepID=UPI003C78A649